MSANLDVLDRRLTTHLRFGGTAFDKVGTEIVALIVQQALRNPVILEATRAHKFTVSDLGAMYTYMVEASRPNPLIKDSSGLAPMLAATLFLLEPFRLEDLLGEISREMPEHASPGERREIVLTFAEYAVRQVLEAHAAARGEPRFRVRAAGGRPTSRGCAVGGCGCMIILSFLALLPCGGAAIYLLGLLGF